MTVDGDNTRLGDAEPAIFIQGVFVDKQVRCAEPHDVYLEFWPMGCDGPAQMPNWELFDQKLSRLLKNNERIRKLTTPAHELHATLKTKYLPDDFVTFPQQEASMSASEFEESSIYPAEKMLVLPPLGHDVDMNGEQGEPDAGSDSEWTLPETPPTFTALDDYWTLIANEMHVERTSLCSELDCLDEEKHDTDNKKSKNDENSEAEQRIVRLRVSRLVENAVLVVCENNDVAEEQAEFLLMRNCALATDLVQSANTPSED